jgi:subtilisin family serine protease
MTLLLGQLFDECWELTTVYKFCVLLVAPILSPSIALLMGTPRRINSLSIKCPLGDTEQSTAPSSFINISYVYSDSFDPTTFDPTYERNSGTSFSAPAVADIAALMLSVNPSLTPDQIEQILIDTASAAVNV